MPSLSSLRAISTPFRLHRQADQRLVAMNRALARVGEQAHPVRLRAVGGPHLAAVDDVVAAVLPRGGLDRGDVRAGAGFRDAEACDVIARDPGPQKFLAQLVRAVARQRRRRHVGLHTDAHRGASRTLLRTKRLAERNLVGIVEPQAAELLRLVDAEQTLLAHFLEQVMRRENAGLFPFLGVRIDLGFDEFRHRAHQLAVLFGIDHGSVLDASSAASFWSTSTGKSSSIWAKPLPCGSLRSEAMPPPPSTSCSTKFTARMPGTSKRST